MSKSLRLCTAACCALFASVPAQAAIDCLGTVSRVLLYSDGSVNIMTSWRGDYTYICNVHGGWGGISLEVCLAWYGALVKAQANNSNVMFYYSTSAYTCSNLPTYASSPAPYYVGVKE